MKKILSVSAALIFAASALSSASSAEYFTRSMESYFAKPVVCVTMPKRMSFIFNPFGIKISETVERETTWNAQKIICSYDEITEASSWDVTNHSNADIKVGVYAWADKIWYDDFRVSDLHKNTVDPTDDTRKYLLLDIRANGNPVTLLTDRLTTDEGEDSPKINLKAGWWSEENADLITVIDRVHNEGTVHITMDGEIQNVGELNWSLIDNPRVYFMFNFEVVESE